MRGEVTRENRPNQVEARVGCRVQRRPKEQNCLTTVGTRRAAVRREVTRESRPNQVEARVGCRVQRRSKEQDCLTMVGTRLAAVRLQVKRESRPNRVEARVGLLAQSCWMQLLTRVIQGVNLSDLNFWAFQATMSQSAF